MDQISRQQMIEAVALAMYQAFIRMPDPEYAERRWQRVPDVTKQNWLREAEAGIQTYERLKGYL